MNSYNNGLPSAETLTGRKEGKLRYDVTISHFH